MGVRVLVHEVRDGIANAGRGVFNTACPDQADQVIARRRERERNGAKLKPNGHIYRRGRVDVGETLRQTLNMLFATDEYQTAAQDANNTSSVDHTCYTGNV